MLKLHHILSVSAALLAVVMCSCSGRSHTDTFEVGEATPDTLTHHARYLTLVDYGNGSTLAEIASPWNPGKTLARYLLVDRDSAVPADIPAATAVLRVPLQKTAVFSSVHTSAMNELGALDALAAVADASYFPAGDTVCALLAGGRVADVGTAQSPSVERLVASGVEAVFRSPMQDMNGAALPRTMTAVEMADYMETSPIARAEWLLLIGELFGKRAEAQAVFENVVSDYSDLALKVKLANEPSPRILTDTEYSGVWYVPAGGSYQARMFADAGADYPWKDSEGSGALSLSLESVADAAIDADMWLVKSYGFETTPASLKAMNPRYTAFKAWKNGDIYSCNSAERLIFNDMAFHPEKILAEYVAIFHPSLMPEYELKYYRRTGP